MHIYYIYTDGRPPGASGFAIPMGNAQEREWLLGMSLPYPRQTPPNVYMCAACSGLRELVMPAQNPGPGPHGPRRDFPPFLEAPLMAFSSTEVQDSATNDSMSLPEVYVAAFHRYPHYDPPILITGVKTCRCSDQLSGGVCVRRDPRGETLAAAPDDTRADAASR